MKIPSVPTVSNTMLVMKLSILLVSCLALGHAAAAVTETYSLNSPTLVPDADLNGIVQTINVTSSGLTGIGQVEVHLDLANGWGGDMYAYLWHNGIISVLVNRPGRSAVLPDGSPASGMHLTLTDLAALDLHLASGALNGTFQPDQRNTHPLTTLDTSLRTTPLSLFNATTPNGEWRLFVADVASGEEATLTSWSFTLSDTVVPEPSQMSLLAATSVALLLRRRRLTER